jgi:hypothetical protein
MRRTRDSPAKTLMPADIVRLVGTSMKMVVKRLDEAGIHAHCIWYDKDDNLNSYPDEWRVIDVTEFPPSFGWSRECRLHRESGFGTERTSWAGRMMSVVRGRPKVAIQGREGRF